MGKNGLRIMDSDMHVFEPHDLYLKYMDSKWGDRIPRGYPREAREAQGLTRHGMSRYYLGDGSPIRPPSEVVRFHEKRQKDVFAKPAARGYDAVSQLEAMDLEGLDVAVLFRTSPLHTNENFEPEYANDLCRAWNSWAADFCKEDPERLKPSALITLHDVELAVKETRRAAKELGAVGLSLCPEPINGRQIHDRYFDPLWAEAQEIGVPICFHPPANPQQLQVAQRFQGHPNQHLLINPLRNPIEQILAVSSFCAGGVLERFPRLRVAFLEGNCSWLPWLLYRIDEYCEMQGDMADIPLRQKPSDYFRQQCFISVDVDEALVKNVIDYLGDENVVISTDYPHIDCRWPHAVDTFLSLPGISEESRRKILWDNCARLYNIADRYKG
jgi:predicted TIM-barrel fold metal-dependent hydrolase